MSNPDPLRLANVPLFQGLGPEELAKIAEWLEVEEYAPGQLPVRGQEHGYAFFILDEGQAHAEVNGQVTEVLQPGGVFGEIAFFVRDGRRTATIVADTPLRVFSMFGTRFRQLQSEMPAVAARIEALATERFARANNASPPA